MRGSAIAGIGETGASRHPEIACVRFRGIAFSESQPLSRLAPKPTTRLRRAASASTPLPEAAQAECREKSGQAATNDENAVWTIRSPELQRLLNASLAHGFPFAQTVSERSGGEVYHPLDGAARPNRHLRIDRYLFLPVKQAVQNLGSVIRFM